ncbi:unnamed protein product [Moneuplotes crassus]|uniref:FCP1 homology domain-containing protein n=1 Tax=Euplotes crassus TaxID=5936 RepID=A0AAD1XU51_EUPCR|nr:unnamed protein product [Moneuplotes crassus]
MNKFCTQGRKIGIFKNFCVAQQARRSFMKKSESAEKMLYVFDLNGVLGYVDTGKNYEAMQKFYTREPDFKEGGCRVWHRPNLGKVAKDMLIKQRGKVNIGIWSCQNKENTEKQLKAFFGRTYSHLLFVFYSSNREQVTQSDSIHDIEPIPMKRDLKMIYDKYSFHNEENTVMISNFPNELDDYHYNEIVLPLYDPLRGQTDFEDDKHMSYLEKYINGLHAMDTYIGTDVRAKINNISYKKFIQKYTKKIRYDSNSFSSGNAGSF